MTRFMNGKTWREMAVLLAVSAVAAVLWVVALEPAWRLFAAAMGWGIEG